VEVGFGWAHRSQVREDVLVLNHAVEELLRCYWVGL
jgi:hypothetical protein